MGRKVGYIYDPEVGNYYYGRNHPMKPLRLNLTHDLVFSYGLQEKMKVFLPEKADYDKLTTFHSSEYVNFLQRLPYSLNNSDNSVSKKFNVGGDCPYFEGVYDYCCSYTGASLEAAKILNTNYCDIAINWSGGLHHAKKSLASGFCYVNDIVIAILELLRYHPRVLYIDIDVHHGDGVQEAFYCTNRVLTLSFHNYGAKYFPGTGYINEEGIDEGLNYAINVPLRCGIDDETFLSAFKPIVDQTIYHFQPTCIVLQCGADSLAGDKLGRFNMSIKGHGSCVQFVKSKNIPMLVLGGGGYTIKNVARCWAYETSLLLDTFIEDKIPDISKYYDYYGPDFSLHPKIETSIINQNSKNFVDYLINHTKEQLNKIEGCPSVQMTQIPDSISNVDLIKYTEHREND